MDFAAANLVSLCTGIGMLDEAVRLGAEQLGIRTRLAMCAEWEAYAAACLRSRMEESSMEPAPIWCGDLAGLKTGFLRGLVGILCAGLPCQPYSLAGQQKGWEDQRSYGDGDGPIPHFLRIVAECRPAVVFVENVPPWVSGGWFRPVGEELSRLGYRVEKPLFVTAEAVGASHRRERVFVLAVAPVGRLRELWQSSGGHGFADGRDESMGESTSGRRRECQPRRRSNRRAAISGPGEQLGHSECDSGKTRGSEREEQATGLAAEGTDRRGEELANSRCPPGNAQLIDQPREGSRRRTATADSLRIGPGCGMLDDAGGTRPQGSKRRIADTQQPAAERSGQSVFAPGPSADWRRIPENLWPASEPRFRLLVDGVALVLDESRADQLRCGGNGVVAIQGAVAFVELMRRAGIG